MRTFSIINLKGGVGKTSIATNAAYFIAQVLGPKVLFIDNDKQGNASQFFDANTEVSLADLLAGEASVEDVIQKTRYSNIDIISADMALADVNLAILNDKSIEQQMILKEQLLKIQNNYDFCIIDHPPDINISVLNSLIITDEIIVVSTPEEDSLHGIKEIEVQIELAKKYNKNLMYRGCVINKMNGSSASFYYYNRIKQDHPIFHTNIHETRNWLNEARKKKLSIFELSPRCGFARDLKKFIAELFYCE